MVGDIRGRWVDFSVGAGLMEQLNGVTRAHGNVGFM